MKIRLLFLLLLSLSSLGVASDATVSADAKPSSANIAGQKYPMVDSQSRVTFGIKAPDAKKIQVDFGGKKYDMTKDAEGVWTVTSDPQAPGFHYYSLLINGVSVVDPSTETFYGCGRMSSGVEVPENGVDFYDVKDVPHGDIRTKWYFSKTANAWRRCFVYLPPQYDADKSTRYPVLYLQHGGGEDERGWGMQGRANFILDNLIA
ncbi:TPA: esterase, partial [Candidatus Sumerlaeota bacterium]|nr:esterase [Candidatus Sumerlaeota bacterium]